MSGNDPASDADKVPSLLFLFHKLRAWTDRFLRPWLQIRLKRLARLGTVAAPSPATPPSDGASGPSSNSQQTHVPARSAASLARLHQSAPTAPASGSSTASSLPSTSTPARPASSAPSSLASKATSSTLSGASRASPLPRPSSAQRAPAAPSPSPRPAPAAGTTKRPVLPYDAWENQQVEEVLAVSLEVSLEPYSTVGRSDADYCEDRQAMHSVDREGFGSRTSPRTCGRMEVDLWPSITAVTGD